MKTFSANTTLLIAFFILLNGNTFAQSYHTYLQNQFQNVCPTNNEVYIYGTDESEAINALDTSKYAEVYCTYNEALGIVNEAGIPFTQKKVVSLDFKVNDNDSWDNVSPWDTRLDITEVNASEGDNLLLVFWVRNSPDVEDTEGAAFVFAKFIFPNDSTTREAIEFVPFTDDWKQWALPITAQSSKLDIQFRLGFLDQSFEIGGIALINYGDCSGATLPTIGKPTTYNGISPDDDWRVDAKNRIEEHRKAPINITVVDQLDTPIPDAQVSIQQLSHEFDFGSSEKALFIKNEYVNKDSLRNLFNVLSFESDMLWDNWIAPKGFNITDPDELCAIINWVNDNDFEFRWHNVLWPNPSHYPSSITSTTGVGDFKNQLSSFVNDVANFCVMEDLITEIDVINEPTLNRDLEKRKYYNDRYTYEYAIEIYKHALSTVKKRFPNAQRYINDYVILDYGGYTQEANARFKHILGEFNPNELEAIGFQAHMKYPVPPETIYNILEEYKSFSYEIKITEFDFVEIDESIRKEYLKDFLTIVFSHPKVNGFQFWNSQNKTDDGWNLTDLPIYDSDGNLKDSGKAFKKLVFGKWWTDTLINTNNNGMVEECAFLGKHVISVQCDGESKSDTITLSGEGEEVILKLPIVLDPSCEVLDNPNFTIGKTPWRTYGSVSAGASFMENFSNGQATIDITNAGSKGHHVQLYQKNLNLLANTDYLITFRAKADANRSIVVEMSEADPPHTANFYETVQLTPNWKYQSILFRTTNVMNNARIVFNLGGNNADVSIDEVHLERFDCSEVCDLVQDNLFEQQSTHWQEHIHNSADAVYTYANNQATFYIDEGGNKLWYVQLYQTGMGIVQGKEYNISFKAKTVSKYASRSIIVDVSDATPPHTAYLYEKIDISDKFKTYNVNFEPNQSDSEVRLVFNLGKNATDIIIDNVLFIDNNCQDDIGNAHLKTFNGVNVHLKAFLEGAKKPHNPNVMNTDLNSVLPLKQPYHRCPWNYTGIEQISTRDDVPSDAVDWVLVEMRAGDNPQILIEQQAALLLKDGSIVQADKPTQVPHFQKVTALKKYYIVLRHRNHLDVMSKNAVAIIVDEIQYDFSSNNQQALGSNQLIEIAPNSNVYALMAGDTDANGIINVKDFNLYSKHSQKNTEKAIYVSVLDLNAVLSVEDGNVYQKNASKIGALPLRYYENRYATCVD